MGQDFVVPDDKVYCKNAHHLHYRCYITYILILSPITETFKYEGLYEVVY